MAYTFDTTLTTAKGSPVLIDTGALYGYWQRLDGTEGGGLWFQRTQQTGGTFGPLDLVDYDGTYELRQDIVDALRAGGITVDEAYDVDTSDL